MPYLLDANVFIEAKKNYYQFDLCPGFWDWLIRENGTGKILSHDCILEELVGYGDKLSEWARNRGHAFFVKMDLATSESLQAVANWVASQPFKDRAKRDFLGGADPILIACGLGHGYTIVSHEVHVQGQLNKVKIPTVCQALNVKCMTPFQMLAVEKVVFELA